MPHNNRLIGNTPVMTACPAPAHRFGQEHRICRGFTLVELLIALAVTAILLTVGIPSIRTMMNSSERATKINDLVGALNLARSESVKRGADITICRRASGDTSNVCASGDGANCDASTHENCWEGGWIVFADNDADGIRDDGEELVRVYEYHSIRHILSPDTNYQNFVRFGSNGAPNSIGAFTYCVDLDADGHYESDEADYWRAVSVNKTGRSNVSSTINGQSLVCSAHEGSS
jgi:type IV fimbrial biogenesis protein FimT